MRPATTLVFAIVAAAQFAGCIGQNAQARRDLRRTQQVPAPVSQVSAGVFQPQCVTLGQPGQGVFDGEVLSDPARMVFTDTFSGGAMWVAALDPRTGLFVTPTGRDQRVAEDVTPLTRIFNGGEWGRDREGAAVYFTKQTNGVDQLWRAPLTSAATLTATPLTSGRERGSPMPRRDPQADSTQMLFIQDGYQRGTLAWLDRKQPTETEAQLQDVDKGMSGPRFITGSADLVYATTKGQIARFRTATNESVVLTQDSGKKGDPFAWAAPELGGKIAVVAIEDMARIVVYAMSDDGARLSRLHTIEMPAAGDPSWKGGDPHPWIFSLEPFAADGKSYFSVHAQRDNVPPPRTTGSSVWVVSMEPINGKLMRMRLDDGTPAKRIDPEFLIGESEVFVYFNVLPAPWKMVRCTTGIKVGDSPIRYF
ncbi:MAG: hypothetical protein SGJ21_02540 [Alphaproteobacteria bacterium]|nr:hypothetical protein [Alphaproteobacteria bacterium]